MRIFRVASTLAVFSGLFLTGVLAQDRDRTRIMPGTVISVRPSEPIDLDRKDFRVYQGIVDQDVRGDDGRLAIPRGAPVELMVRVEPNNDLVLGVESVTVNGRRYALRTDNGRVESLPDRRLVSAIVGDSGGSQVPRDTLLSFRILRPLEMTVPDRGIEFDRP